MLTIELPFPPAELNPNRKNGRHWGATHAVKEAYKRDCWALALAAFGTSRAMPAGDIPLSLTFVQPDKRRRDRDNLLASCKAALDGLAAALKVDDSRFEPVTIRREFGKKPGAVVVTVGAPCAA
jgi:crossover junction endodeoxyribonuclease RusA